MKSLLDNISYQWDTVIHQYLYPSYLSLYAFLDQQPLWLSAVFSALEMWHKLWADFPQRSVFWWLLKSHLENQERVWPALLSLQQLSGPLFDVYNNACRWLFDMLAEAVMCKIWLCVTSRDSSYRFQCGFEYFFLLTGCRSVSRDLETQIAIVTKNPQLQQSLLEERERLYASSTPFNSETLSKPDRKHTPLWVHVIMRLFRGLF